MKTLLFLTIAVVVSSIVLALDTPIMEWRFDEEPVLKAKITDHIGETHGQLLPGKNPNGLPKLITQDVPCVTAWDFSESDCVFVVTSETAMEQLGNPADSKGMALAFWINFDNAEKTANHLRALGWSPFLDCVAMDDGLDFLVPGESSKDENRRPMVKTGSANGVLDGNWHHVVLSIDFSSGDSNLAISVDGLETQVSSVTFNPATWETRPKFFTIANRWPGSFGRFQAWNRPLSSAEVARMFSEKGSP